MRNKLDNILLGLLWLLASTLAVCFWFNTQFGFDIFSKSHWHHLAYMQATQKPIQPVFYISMIISVIIIMCVLYFLIRPRRSHTVQATTQPPITEKPVVTKEPSVQQQPIRPVTPHQPVNIQRPTPPQINMPRPASPMNMPSRQFIPTPSSNSNPSFQLHEIFKSAGYKIVKNPNISDVNISLVAVGSNETLWMGGVGISVPKMHEVLGILKQIFLDTLEDVSIKVNTFIVQPTTPDRHNDILTFNTMDELRRYVMSHSNPDTNFNDESFIAYETYITTVMDYIGKL
jgi:hypothetical protein